MKPRVLTPAEYLTGDTSRTDYRFNIPGSITGTFSSMQDTLYKRALSSRVTAQSRFAFDVRATADAFRITEALERPTSTWENIHRNMSIPAALLQPSDQERAQYNLNIANAMHVPGILMYPMGTGNLQVSFGAIASLLGLSEDVSPRIRYIVDETTEVTITVYSSSALSVATIFNGIQAPGAYEIVWDGLNENHAPVNKGDFVAEVRLGNNRMQRKRIVWPPAGP